MKTSRLIVASATALIVVVPSLLLALSANAQAPAAKTGAGADAKPAVMTKSQSELANPKAVFGTISGTDAKVKSAVDAHNLAGAKALIGKGGELSGTVAGTYSPRSNKIVILNFDQDYKSAVSAVVEASSFAKFPDLKSLTGKKVVVIGKFTAFKTGAELMISEPSDIKLIK